MRTKPLLLNVLGVALLSAGSIAAHAADGRFYDPRNAASPTGFTTGYELFRTIGCPGRGLLDTPCPVPPPADSDGDGVTDDKDKCPGTPAGRKVNADGCELDRDGDGIVDGDDACPDVYAKTPNGCPEPVAATPPAQNLAPEAVYAAGSATEPADIPRRLVLEGVNFDFDKATLRQEDRDIIDQNAADLKEWGDVKVEISGHTDSIGSDRYNMGLSLRRANSVRSYLISKGVAADRLVTKGYGEAQPIADNETEEGRFKNRRVELNQIKN